MCRYILTSGTVSVNLESIALKCLCGYPDNVTAIAKALILPSVIFFAAEFIVEIFH